MYEFKLQQCSFAFHLLRFDFVWLATIAVFPIECVLLFLDKRVIKYHLSQSRAYFKRLIYTCSLKRCICHTFEFT